MDPAASNTSKLHLLALVSAEWQTAKETHSTIIYKYLHFPRLQFCHGQLVLIPLSGKSFVASPVL